MKFSRVCLKQILNLCGPTLVFKTYQIIEGKDLLSLPYATSAVYGTNSVHFKGMLIWNKLPYFIKSNASVF